MGEMRGMNRREFGQAAATVALAAAGGRAMAAPNVAGEVKPGLYSITYLGVWYKGEALTVEQVIGRARKSLKNSSKNDENGVIA